MISNYYDKYSIKNDEPVLDVGAGTGLIAEVMNKKKTIDIDAIDISPEMLESAKSKNCYNKLIEADLTKKLDIDKKLDICDMKSDISSTIFLLKQINSPLLLRGLMS